MTSNLDPDLNIPLQKNFNDYTTSDFRNSYDIANCSSGNYFSVMHSNIGSLNTNYDGLEKRHISILPTRNVMWTLFWRPPPLRNVTHFFRFCRGPCAIIYLAGFKSEVVYKSIKVHLRQNQDLIMSIHIYLKYKYTYKNAGFCILCIDDFKILKIFN